LCPDLQDTADPSKAYNVDPRGRNWVPAPRVILTTVSAQAAAVDQWLLHSPGIHGGCTACFASVSFGAAW
jgi:hypothetical protein